MDTRTAAVTVRSVEPLTLLSGSVAVMVLVPLIPAEVRPLLPDTSLTVATLVSAEDQVTSELTSLVLLSSYIPMATSC